MRTLKAELAAAAREARTEARGAGRTVRVDPAEQSSRAQLQHADAVLNEFRSALRSDLRLGVAQGRELTAESVELLRSGLENVRTSILAALE